MSHHENRGSNRLGRLKPHHGGDLAEVSLDEAYKTARLRKDAASIEEQQLADIRERHSDLADKVVEGDLTLPAA